VKTVSWGIFNSNSHHTHSLELFITNQNYMIFCRVLRQRQKKTKGHVMKKVKATRPTAACRFGFLEWILWRLT
jgi:hypothetical protein